MVTGIWIAIIILIVGLFSGMGEISAENTYTIVILSGVIVLALTLSVTTTPKSMADELAELQKYCIAIGVATMTPEVTVSKFSLLPPMRVPVLGEDYFIATGVTHLAPEFKGELDDK